MSILMHFCRACGHAQSHHLRRPGDDPDLYEPSGTTGVKKACRCCGLGDTPRDIDPQPRLVETWTCPDHKPEPLQHPGSTWNAGTAHRQALCGCTGCQAAYEAARP